MQIKRLSMLAASVMLASQAHAAVYQFNLLGNLEGPDAYSSSSATAINNLGVVVGESYLNGQAHAVAWNGLTAVDLGVGRALAVNQAKTAVGYADYNTPMVWANGAGHALPGLGAVSRSAATGINSSGQIAGYTYSNSEGRLSGMRAVRWDNGVAVNLGTLGGNYSEAYGINDAGQVFGIARDSKSETQAVVWNGNQISTVKGLNGSSSSTRLVAINNNGQLAGSSYTPGAWGQQHATMWDGTRAIDLGTLGGTYSVGRGINSTGFVVGNSEIRDQSGSHAFVWDGHHMLDLNTLINSEAVDAGWVLGNANGINDQGSIIGFAQNTITGKSGSFLLTVGNTPIPTIPEIPPAIPEPETWGMLLAGLGALVWLKKRRAA